jgi:predicted membrane protein
MRQGRCEWVVRLNHDLPTELNVRFGAGRANLKLGGLALEQLRVESGVGQLSLDLSGEWRRSLQVHIKSGIGDTHVRLPVDAGVRLQSTVGFGSLHADGLSWDGEAYTNSQYGQAAVSMEITVEGGMGKVILEQVG